MLAVIEYAGGPGLALLPIAGRPLLLRQLQWLRACGFDRVAVEVPRGPAGEEMVRCMTDDPLGWDVVPVVTDRNIGPLELARAASFDAAVPVLAMPGDVLGGGDLAQVYLLACSFSEPAESRGNLSVELPCPAFATAGRPPATLLLVGGTGGADRSVPLDGWGMRIASAADAIELGAAALEQRSAATGLLVHAAELSRGIWLARGARIQPGAEIIPPVLLGVGAIVRSGARLGPRVFVGEGAVIERGAMLSDAIVDRDTIVGENVRVSKAHVTASGLRGAEPGGLFVPIDDPLLLAHRKSQAAGHGITLRIALIGAALLAVLLVVAGLAGR